MATFQLEAINPDAGVAVFSENGGWFHLSVDDAWRPTPLETARDVIRCVQHGHLRASERSFDSRLALVTFVRERWLEAAPLLRVGLESVLDFLPLEIKDAAEDLSTSSKMHDAPPNWELSPPLYAEVWHLALRIAAEYPRQRTHSMLFVEADDVAGDVIVRLIESAETRRTVLELFEGPRRFLHRFVRNRVTDARIDGIRRQGREPISWPLPFPPRDPLPLGDPLLRWTTTPYLLSIERGEVPEGALIDKRTVEPHDLVERVALGEAIDRAIGWLPEHDAAIVRARLFSGLPFSDVAKAFDIGYFTAVSRYLRAIEKLRRFLLNLGFGWLEE